MIIINNSSVIILCHLSCEYECSDEIESFIEVGGGGNSIGRL